MLEDAFVFDLVPSKNSKLVKLAIGRTQISSVLSTDDDSNCIIVQGMSRYNVNCSFKDVIKKVYGIDEK